MYEEYESLTPDIGRENHEAYREEQREEERNSLTIAEEKEAQQEMANIVKQEADDIRKEMAERERNDEYAWDANHGLI